ncbi:MAG: 2,5-diamino-6-(ribosylamino)-4(3H)-pyrimidinone 5'-phosphate reductase [Methanomicrobiales archaeon]|nr:2,5-diamino-6-(ribosylamino)-4(3H)-pyrimidinone 5'-phosphate reductase [Methanomicrobiales archaeon]
MRPLVVVNVAMSADGKISTRERRQVRISGAIDRARVDRLKAESDAIMVGIGTVLADNPSLTVKSSELREQRVKKGLEENPIRIVVDSLARTPPDADILHKGRGSRIIAISDKADSKAVKALTRHAEVIRAGSEEVDLRELLEKLGDRRIHCLMVEGGGRLIGALFRTHLVDELYTYVGNIVIGGDGSPTPSDGPGFLREEEFVHLHLVETSSLEEGVLIHWRVEKK